MPRVNIFVACHTAIIDSISAELSIIRIFENVQVSVLENSDVPENSTANLSWALVVNWSLFPDEIGKAFNQKIRVITPSGKVAFNDPGMSLEAGQHGLKTIVNVPDFPGTEEGIHTIKLLVAEEGAEFQEISSYLVNVEHIPVTVEVTIA